MVPGESQSASAISAFVLPRATHAITSDSRGVSPTSSRDSSSRSWSPERSIVRLRLPSRPANGLCAPSSSQSTTCFGEEPLGFGEELVQQPLSRRRSELCPAGGVEEDDAVRLLLVRVRERAERRRQQSPRPGSAPDPFEVRLQQVENEAVALGEVAPPPLERERP